MTDDCAFCGFCGMKLPVKCDYISLMPKVGSTCIIPACPTCFGKASESLSDLKKSCGDKIPDVRTSIVIEVGRCFELNPYSSAAVIAKIIGHPVTDVLKAIENIEKKNLCSIEDDGSFVMKHGWERFL